MSIDIYEPNQYREARRFADEFYNITFTKMRRSFDQSDKRSLKRMGREAIKLSKILLAHEELLKDIENIKRENDYGVLQNDAIARYSRLLEEFNKELKRAVLFRLECEGRDKSEREKVEFVNVKERVRVLLFGGPVRVNYTEESWNDNRTYSLKEDLSPRWRL